MAKGFNRPAGGGKGQGGMMAQLQRMQQQLAEAQAALAEETVTATAGGGATGASRLAVPLLTLLLPSVSIVSRLRIDCSATCKKAMWASTVWRCSS